MIAYTSGTTGRPKGAVHVQAGLTVKLAAEGAFHAEIGREDVVMGDRHGMDHGTVDGARRSGQRGGAGHLRRRSRSSRPGSALGGGGQPRSHLSRSHPLSSAPSSPTAPSMPVDMISPGSTRSARPANHGTPSPGAGSSRRSARSRGRSSTSRAGPRSAPSSSV